MANKPLRVILDSNVLISAYVFGGKPEIILKQIIQEQIQGVTSPILISEFLEVLRKKFSVVSPDILEIQNDIEELFEIVYPRMLLRIQKDDDDNRVLEAALEGKCKYIVTGDKELLKLGVYQDIKIVTADQFLKILEEN
ncbi:MAG: putative toxin-antitoxin system toxin component, PIN family [bacterium]|nr:putative toxin-antitoxin system toxin component, PIN family [bacterium]